MAPYSSGLLSSSHASSSSKPFHVRSPSKLRSRWSSGRRQTIASVFGALLMLLTIIVYLEPGRVGGVTSRVSGFRERAESRVALEEGESELDLAAGRVLITELWPSELEEIEGSEEGLTKVEAAIEKIQEKGSVNGRVAKKAGFQLLRKPRRQEDGRELGQVKSAGLLSRPGREIIADGAVRGSENEPQLGQAATVKASDVESTSGQNNQALNHFLTRVEASTGETSTENAINKLEEDEVMQQMPSNSSATPNQESFEPSPKVLKVYMYDLPSKFNWGLLSRASELGVNLSEPFSVNGPPFPAYQGGLSHQHSPEYWLTIDLLTDPSAKKDTRSVAKRVADPAQADVFFVPYWASLAYNMYIPARGEYTQELQLQQELVDWLQAQEHWRRSGGRDHLLVLHHPNAMAALRSRLASAMWVLADFARYPREEANLEKDVIAPYAHMVPHFDDDLDEERAWSARTTLLFFQGSLFRKRDGLVRELLLNVLKNEPDVIVREGHTDEEGVREASEGMRSAKFCLHPAGDTPSSNRLFDAIFSHCVPVVVSDTIELPFEDALDYREFTIFVASRNAVTPGVLVEFLRSIPRRMWARMWWRLHEVAPFFEYDNPASPSGAVNRVWNEVALRVPSRRLEIHRALRRVHQTDTEGLRAMERRLQRMDPSFVKIERKKREAPQNHRKVQRRY